MREITFKFFLIFILFAGNSHAQKFTDIEDIGMNYYGNVTAPDFHKELEWLNTDKQYSIKDFRGKLVLLDFWTYCCINCIHIMPDLKKLEEKYKNELVVIGVHSAKFLTERGTDNIRQAILRYEIEHPVINDKDFDVWDSYTAKAWPTLVLVDPNGKIIGMSTGEGVFDTYDPVISSAISEYDMAGNILNRQPIKFILEKEKAPKSLLSFPGKITADSKSGRLFITDSNNNRVIILSLNENGFEAKAEEVIGSGIEGNKDGPYTKAQFFRPQGIAFANDKLYIADTENHLIRVVDLVSKQVKTIAGLGYQSKEYGIISGNALETALNSPWDLIVIGDELYIAMAGRHQLWKMNLSSGTIGTYAGSGRESIVDDFLLESALSQPSGITTDGVKLYFADSEVSAIRSADLNNSRGKVKTIVGMGLFDFGDLDGIGDKVRLQHPLGIFYNPADELIYVADTYNSKIKVVNPLTRESRTYAGTGFTGTRDGIKDAAQFDEPNGLTILNGNIYVTDTNNNLIRVIDMATGEIKTLKITNPEKLTAGMITIRKKKPDNIITLSPLDLKQGNGFIKFNFKLPEGYHINPEALPQVAVTSDGDIIEPVEMEVSTKSPEFEVPVNLTGNSGEVIIEVLVYYCDTENAGICKYRDLYFELPVTISGSGGNVVNIDHVLM